MKILMSSRGAASACLPEGGTPGVSKRYSGGSTLVELIMVLSLLAVFGITIFMLIYTGAETQQRVMDRKSAQIDARIALSYINVKLRQNDSSECVEIERLDLTGQNAIKIKYRGIDPGFDYDTWIYCVNGRLMECLVEPGGQPTELLSFFIVNIHDFETEINETDGSVTNTIYYYYGDTLSKLSSTVYPRSVYERL